MQQSFLPITKLGLSNNSGDSMLKFKDGKTQEQAIDDILRDYLLRCFATVSKQYEPIQNMSPQQGVEYLFKMRNERKINISLYAEGELVKCNITLIN